MSGVDITALTQAAGFGTELDLHLTTSPRGTSLQDLAGDPDLVSRLVDDYLLSQQTMLGPTTRRDIAALWMLQDVSWAYAVFAVGLMPMHRISLLPRDDALRIHLPRDMFFAVELDPNRVDMHVATTAAETTERYQQARQWLSVVLAPVVDAMLAHLHAGPRAAWACVTDMATGAVSTGASRLRSEQLEPELRQVTRSSTEPADRLLHGLRMRQSPTGPIRVRHGCCLLYAVEGMDLCFSCPRIVER